MSTKAILRRPLDRCLGPVAGSIMHLDSQRREVVITFDDGPVSPMTEQLAHVLARHDARAVFFVLMTRVSRAPTALLRDLLAAGHEIGLHGLDHRRLPSLTGSDAASWLRRSKADLEDVTGQSVRWFRPPHGAQSPRNHLQAKRLGLTTVLWSGTTWDWRDASHDERVTKALSAARPGAILLAHDGAADASDLAVEEAVPDVDKVALLEDILTGLRERDLAAVTLSEALAGATPVRRLSFAR